MINQSSQAPHHAVYLLWSYCRSVGATLGENPSNKQYTGIAPRDVATSRLYKLLIDISLAFTLVSCGLQEVFQEFRWMPWVFAAAQRLFTAKLRCAPRRVVEAITMGITVRPPSFGKRP